jgi:CRP-like cAMP-binding protein
LDELSGKLRRRRYRRGEVVFLRGDPGVNLCIVDTGRVKLTLTSESQGREVAFALMGPHDVFGELALLDGEPRSADAVAVEPTELLLLGRDDFLQFLRTHPDMALALLADLGRRLRRDLQTLQDATFLDVTARVAQVVLGMAERQEDGSFCTPATTQSNLAALALTTRETANQSLHALAEQDLLRWEGKRVRVLDQARLRQRVY